jgi:hypothetical protein
MLVNSFIDDESVAHVISQGDYSLLGDYYVKIEAVGRGNTELRGVILKLASVNAGVSFGFDVFGRRSVVRL